MGEGTAEAQSTSLRLMGKQSSVHFEVVLIEGSWTSTVDTNSDSLMSLGEELKPRSWLRAVDKNTVRVAGQHLSAEIAWFSADVMLVALGCAEVLSKEVVAIGKKAVVGSLCALGEGVEVRERLMCPQTDFWGARRDSRDPD